MSSSLTKKGESLDGLFNKAVNMALRQPDKFAIQDTSNDWQTAVVARTTINYDGFVGEIVLDLSRHEEETTQSLYLRDDNEIIYRIDETSSLKVKQKRDLFVKLIDSLHGNSAVGAMLESGYSIDANGRVTAYTDNFAETRINKTEASSIISNGRITLPRLNYNEVPLDQATEILRRKIKLISG